VSQVEENRYDKCNALLFRVEQEKDVYVEIKCRKCGKVNKIHIKMFKG